MRNIVNNKIDKTIYDFEKTGKPILAICLGFQMLFSKSFELEIETPGLEILSGEIIRLPEKIVKKIPHVGWNRVLPIKKNDYINDNEAFYFVHSYYVELKDNSFILSNTNYNNKIFCSSILKKNILGCQFHPEKSGKVGLKLIHSFFTNV
jgi:imidazole glycerol-phosphate synthase subunit HisH